MRTLIKLVSSAGTGHFYTTSKNPKTSTAKLEMKKYDPVVRKHVPYREANIKRKFIFDKEPPGTGRLFLVSTRSSSQS